MPDDSPPPGEVAPQPDVQAGWGASSIRSAGYRALVSGAAGTVACALLGLGFGYDWSSVGVVAFQGFLGGLVLGAVALLEALAWPRGAPSARRLLLVSAAVWPLAALLCWGAALESVYARSFSTAFDVDAARDELLRTLGVMGDRPARFSAMFVALGLPFALGTLGRGAGARVWEQVVTSIMGAVPFASALLLTTKLCNRADARFCFGIVCAASAFLPVAAWLGDLVERRLRKLPAPPPRLQQREFLWAAVGVLTVAGAPVAHYVAQNRYLAHVNYVDTMDRLLDDLGQQLLDDEFLKAEATLAQIDELGVAGFQKGQVAYAREELYFFLGKSYVAPVGYPAWGNFESSVGDRERRARFRLEQGDFEGATSDAEFVLKGINDLQSHRLLAEICARGGNAKRTWELFEEYKTLEPDMGIYVFPEELEPQLKAWLNEANGK